MCDKGHRFRWDSSEVLVNQNSRKIYTDNLHFAAATLMSGNNYQKLVLFAHFLGLHIPVFTLTNETLFVLE